jgi:dTDP-4-dehydrorhamnose 3,5-epimerase
MQLEGTRISGVWLVRLDLKRDERGYFARTFDRSVFTSLGIDPAVDHSAVSWNVRRGTVRGMHLQREPYGETKLVRCSAGAIFDVAVDLRRESPTFGQWEGFELTARGDRMLCLPPGVAHGFQTLADDTEVTYVISTAYQPEASTGVRWDDAEVAVRWPLQVTSISERDQALPPLAAWRAA